MNKELISAYMDTAERFAALSKAVKLKVGAIAVKDDRIISIGYNGTPSGWNNSCEDVISTYDERDTYHQEGWSFDESTKLYTKLETKPEVLHAEMNALMKLAKSNESGNGAAMFITHSPCIHCAKGIFQAGFAAVYYRELYRDSTGLKFLNQCGIDTIRVSNGTPL